MGQYGQVTLLGELAGQCQGGTGSVEKTAAAGNQRLLSAIFPSPWPAAGDAGRALEARRVCTAPPSVRTVGLLCDLKSPNRDQVRVSGCSIIRRSVERLQYRLLPFGDRDRLAFSS
jgi:hypothetical protein